MLKFYNFFALIKMTYIVLLCFGLSDLATLILIIVSKVSDFSLFVSMLMLYLENFLSICFVQISIVILVFLIDHTVCVQCHS